jgi:hypothetical protein
MTVTIGRRELLAALGGAAAAWPLAARAQQTGRLPTIGFFSAGSALAIRDWVAALVQRLGELGWIEGRIVAIEYSGWRASNRSGLLTNSWSPHPRFPLEDAMLIEFDDPEVEAIVQTLADAAAVSPSVRAELDRLAAK